jgi:hypothetical protein
MLLKLSDTYWWRNMRGPVERFLSNCSDCQEWRPSRAVAPPLPIVPLTRTERVIFDYAYVKLASGKAKWMLWGRTFSHGNGTNVASFIRETFSKGQFRLWQCDNGSHFRNDIVKTAIETTPNVMARSNAPMESSREGLLSSSGRTPGQLHRKHSIIGMAPHTAEKLEQPKPDA